MTDTDSTRALMAQIDSLVIQRDAAEALAREASDERDAYTVRIAEIADDVLGVQPAASSSIALLGAIEVRHHPVRIDLVLDRAREDHDKDRRIMLDRLRAAHEAIEALRPLTVAKSHPVDIYDRARDAIDAYVRAPLAAEAREEALGLQVVAQAARLRLADDLYQCLQGCRRCQCLHPACSWCRDDGDIVRALAAWDAVPGDVGVKAPATDARLVGPDGEPER